MASTGGAENEVQKWKVAELKSYLQSRGITVSQKRKEELVELVEGSRSFTEADRRLGETGGWDSQQVADEKRFAPLSQHVTL